MQLPDFVNIAASVDGMLLRASRPCNSVNQSHNCKVKAIGGSNLE
jgi:hypothetical protein